jgi:hypothetical protein
MNTVTIHYFRDFHTRNVYGFVFALVCGAIIGYYDINEHFTILSN